MKKNLGRSRRQLGIAAVVLVALVCTGAALAASQLGHHTSSTRPGMGMPGRGGGFGPPGTRPFGGGPRGGGGPPRGGPGGGFRLRVA